MSSLASVLRDSGGMCPKLKVTNKSQGSLLLFLFHECSLSVMFSECVSIMFLGCLCEERL